MVHASSTPRRSRRRTSCSPPRWAAAKIRTSGLEEVVVDAARDGLTVDGHTVGIDEADRDAGRSADRDVRREEQAHLHARLEEQTGLLVIRHARLREAQNTEAAT